MITRREYDHTSVELPAFRGMILPVAFGSDGTVWIPIKSVCDALGVQDRVQRDRLRADSNFTELLDKVPFDTIKGPRDMLSIEWEGFGAMLLQIQDHRVGNPQAQERLRTFRKQAYKGINKAILARQKSVNEREDSDPDGVAGLRSLALHTEDRVSRLERLVLITPEDDDDTRTGHCPYCGGAIRVTIGRIEAVDE